MKAKIVLICDEMGGHGGRERVVSFLCNEWCESYEVYLITLWNAESAYFLRENVHFSYLQDKKKRLRYSLISDIKSLRKFLKKEQINLIICEGLGPVLQVFAATRGLPIKVIFHEHSNAEARLEELITKDTTWKHRYHMQSLQHIINRYMDGFVVLTQKEADFYKDCFCVPEEKIHVIYNFLDDTLLSGAVHYDVASKAIITVGRIANEKGYEYLIEVAKKVFAQHPDWHWDIYGGDGKEEYVRHIRDLISENELENYVFLKGIYDNIYDMYPKYGIYVMTSRYEGLPMVLLEAKAKKLPIISFDIHAGPSDIIRDGIDGYLVPPFDTDAMADRICYLIEHPEVRKDFSDHAYGNLDKFRKETILTKWKDLIEGMMGEKDESENT